MQLTSRRGDLFQAKQQAPFKGYSVTSGWTSSHESVEEVLPFYVTTARACILENKSRMTALAYISWQEKLAEATLAESSLDVSRVKVLSGRHFMEMFLSWKWNSDKIMPLARERNKREHPISQNCIFSSSFCVRPPETLLVTSIYVFENNNTSSNSIPRLLLLNPQNFSKQVPHNTAHSRSRLTCSNESIIKYQFDR